MTTVPPLRIRAANRQDIRQRGEFVLYWMIANRRTTWNFSLQRAVQWARDLKRPLLVLEALRCGYPWASDRIHQFILQGMADNAACMAKLPTQGALYYPYLEPNAGAGSGLLTALASRAAVVVTDEFPCFFLPKMVAAAAERLDVRLEAVDSNGLLPLRGADRSFTMAFHFRRFLQKNLRPFLEEEEFPEAQPLAHLHLPPLGSLPAEIAGRWPVADLSGLAQGAKNLARLPIDHKVGISEIAGGSHRAEQVLDRFLANRLEKYADARNEPDEEIASGLSPYLHFGHISAHQIFRELAGREGWSLEALATKADGKKEHWWGLSPAAEAFADELITWRELGYNFCSQRADYDRYESLPPWAQATLAKHATDPREHVYSLAEFEHSQTHDPLWNAAQRQLVREGRIHNYLRMLWGKKIVEWSGAPRDALATMIELNNKYALDGRNPNSYSGIFWVLGRFDRAWGPERAIFGTVRYMSSENTARKVGVRQYLTKYACAKLAKNSPKK